MSENEKTPLDLLREYSVQDSFETLKDHMARAMLFPEKRRARKWCLQKAVETLGKNGLFVEFGVWTGSGVNLFAKLLEDQIVWGFDSFEGLEEDWTGHAKGGQAGRFTLNGMMPDVERNVRLVKGWVQDTVPGWLKEHPDDPIHFAHFDLDTYTPTRFVLEAIQSRLIPGSVLLFDELYGYPGWREHEWRALQEVLSSDSYRFISFSEQSVGIQMR